MGDEHRVGAMDDGVSNEQIMDGRDAMSIGRDMPCPGSVGL